MTSPVQRLLIVNADDFGRTPGINRGVVQAHERGIVTSASLMVRWPAAVEAAAYCRSHPTLDLGLHLDLGEWAYEEQGWQPVYAVCSTDDPGAVADEVARQLLVFRKLMGRDPSHLDSHQHVHLTEPVTSVLAAAAEGLDIPLRARRGGVPYSGAFYGQSGRGEPWDEGITVEHLLRILVQLPVGITELGCHPGYGDDVDSVYRHQRDREVLTLCDPRVAAALRQQDIVLTSFGHAQQP